MAENPDTMSTIHRIGRIRRAWGPIDPNVGLFLLPGLGVLVLVVVVPTVQLLLNSLYYWNLLSGTKSYVGLGEYGAVLTDPVFDAALVRTLIFTLCVVAAELILGLVTALLFDRHFRGARLLRTLYLTPMLMIPIVVGLLWRLMYEPSLGVVDYLLGLIGLPAILWIADTNLALLSIGIAEVWQWTPFVTLVLLAGLQGLPRNVVAAATLDGAGRLRRLFTIDLPLLRNVILVVALLRFIDVFKTFTLVYIVTRGGPGSATVTVGFYTWEVGFSKLSMGQASAAAFIVLNVISLLTFLLIRYIFRIQGEAS